MSRDLQWYRRAWFELACGHCIAGFAPRLAAPAFGTPAGAAWVRLTDAQRAYRIDAWGDVEMRACDGCGRILTR